MIEMVVATIKVSVIVLVALAATRLMRRRSAALRHWILAAAIACAVAAPLLGPVVPSWHVDFGMASTVHRRPRLQKRPAAAVDIASPVAGNEAQTAVDVGARNGDPGRARGVDPLALVWVAGLTVGLGLLIVGVVRLRWLESRSSADARRPMDPHSRETSRVSTDYVALPSSWRAIGRHCS